MAEVRERRRDKGIGETTVGDKVAAGKREPEKRYLGCSILSFRRTYGSPIAAGIIDLEAQFYYYFLPFRQPSPLFHLRTRRPQGYGPRLHNLVLPLRASFHDWLARCFDIPVFHPPLLNNEYRQMLRAQ